MPPSNNLNTYSQLNTEKDNSIYLILSSAANIEFELAKLIDVEASEIRLLTSVANDSKLFLSKSIVFNKSLQKILKNLCMLQMLLQLKLEYISKIMTVYTPNAEINLTELAAVKDYVKKTKMKLYGFMLPSNTDKVTLHHVKGRAHGGISKKFDQFYHGVAIIQLDVDDTCSKDNLLCYTAMKGTKMMNFSAYSNSLIISLEQSGNGEKVTMEGMGSIVIKERLKSDKRDIGNFKLTIYIDKNENEKNFFEMTIKTTRVDFIQKSGKISAECSNLQIKTG